MGPGIKSKWLLEMPYEKDHPITTYLSKIGDLTTDSWSAKQFDTEAQAQMYKDKYLMQSLQNIEPVDHMFIPS